MQKHQLNLTNDGGHTRATDTSKSAIELTIISPSLQPILSWNISDSPVDSDHCVITTNIPTRSREPQSTIAKFNMNETDLHLFTSNEVWKQTTNPNFLKSAEALTENFYSTNKCAVEFAVPIIEIKKNQALVG